jgi:O-antigen/teichoic acid export membrane protein
MTVIASVVWRAIATGGAAVLTACLSAFVAHRLDPEKLASFALAYVTATVAATVADFGTGPAMTRALAGRNLSSALLTAFVWVRVCVGALIGLLVGMAGPVVAAMTSLDAIQSSFVAAGFVVLSRSLCQALQSVAQGLRLWFLDALVAIGGPLFSIGLLVWCATPAAATPSLIMALHGIGYGLACAAGTALVIVVLRGRSFGTAFDGRYLDELLVFWRFAWPMGIASVAFYLMTWGENLIMASWRPAPEVSAFFLATTILMVPRLMFSIVESVAFVEMSGTAVGGRGLRDVIGVAEALVVVPLCLLLIVAYYTLEPLVLLIYGHRHVEAAVAAVWLLPSVFVRLVTIPTTTALSGGLGDSRSLRDSQILALVARLGLGLMLIPVLGYKGAAISAFVAHLGCWLFLSWRSDHRIGRVQSATFRMAPLLISAGLVVLTEPLGSLGRWVPLVTAVTGWIVAASWLFGAEISQAVSRLELARIPSPASPVV